MSKVDDFRNGIFTLHTRRFGMVAELMIKKQYGFDDSNCSEYDLYDPKNKKCIEVKFSRVLKTNRTKINSKNVVTQCINASSLKTRALSSIEIDKHKFDSNIQQIKCGNFDNLYYGLFFTDKIEIYRLTKAKVKKVTGYSDYQHSGNKGEGQFHINNNTIAEHRKYLIKALTYEELYDLLK